MSFISKILSSLGLPKKITLIGQEREDGSTFITCREYPGFTFLLEPGEDESIRALMAAIEEPFMAFLQAQAKFESRQERLSLTGIRHSSRHNYVAELSHA